MRVYEAMGQTLQRLGVDALFGLMGSANMHLVTHWQTALGLPYYAARHEGAAVAMADGYARVSGRVGVATVTEGPGVTNALTALAEAVKASSPLLLVSGDTPPRLLHHPQDIDEEAVCSSVGVSVQRVRAADTIVPDLARAYHRALAEQRPILVAVRGDFQGQECPTDVPTLTPVRRQPVRPTAAAVEQMADLVQTARRPAIIGGRGAVRANAREPLERLADRIGALLATTGQAKGLFAGHPYYVGGSGVFSSRLGVRVLGEADLVLAFGASLNYYTTRNRELYARTARFVQVDRNDAALGALTPVDLGVVGDAAATAEALLDELERRSVAATGFHSADLRREIADQRAQAHQFVDQTDGRTVDPRALMTALERLLPPDRAVVQDSGHSMGWPATYLSVSDATAYIFANDFMVVGLGPAMAFGATVARPDRLTVGVVGDGGMMMSLGELDTLVRYQLPILVLVMNDSAYGIEVHLLAEAGQSIQPAQFQDRDFAAIARAAGARGATVRRLEDLAPLHDWLRAPAGPLVLDCKLDPRLRADWFDAMIGPDSWLARMAAH